uniref:Zinc carboxypeptidase n=1 Tax=Megaviridae environmental sample TaxID=1737588 RepID=A0A5J6VKW9_9VIRU|nr:MAG: zinc carboxypeptidase [Megaviridae environmental sample]
MKLKSILSNEKVKQFILFIVILKVWRIQTKNKQVILDTHDKMYNTPIFVKRNIGANIIAFEHITHKDENTIIYMANMHGDETVGRILMKNLLDFFRDTPDHEIMKRLNVIIIPTLNPKKSFIQRRTSNNTDMNRDFCHNKQKGSCPETDACMKYLIKLNNTYNIKYAINFHGGALCASYPLDAHPQKHNKYSKCKDDNFLRKMAQLYADNHPTMRNHHNNGITNGAEWYHCDNTLQDWMYKDLKIPNITLEVSRMKNPFLITSLSKEEQYWNDNKQSLLKSLEVFIDKRKYIT